MSKAEIGGVSVAEARADSEQRRADSASSDLTMIQRRIRTFYDELTTVQFPLTAPEWATDWKEWLLTGEVTVELEVEPEIQPEAPADGAEVEVADINGLDAELNAAIDAEFETLEPVPADEPADPALTIEIPAE